MQKFHTFYLKNLHMSEKYCNFARNCVHNENNKESGKLIVAPLLSKLSWSYLLISTDR